MKSRITDSLFLCLAFSSMTLCSLWNPFPLLAAEPTPETQFSRVLDLGRSQEEKGEWKQALDTYAQAIEGAHKVLDSRLQRLGENDPEVAEAMDSLADVYLTRRNLLEKAGYENGKETRELCDFVLVYQRAEWIRTRAYATPFHPKIAQTLDRAARLWWECHPPMAEKFFKAAVSCRENIFGPHHEEVAEALDRYARYLQGPMMDFKGARSLYERALKIREDRFGPNDFKTITNLTDLARVAFFMGDKETTKKLMQRAVETIQAKDTPENPEMASSLHALALLEDEMGNPARARILLQQTREIINRCCGPHHLDMAGILMDQARMDRNENRTDQALALYERSLAILEIQYGPEHPALEEAILELIGLFQERGEREQAEKLNTRLEHILAKKGL